MISYNYHFKFNTNYPTASPIGKWSRNYGDTALTDDEGMLIANLKEIYSKFHWSKTNNELKLNNNNITISLSSVTIADLINQFGIDIVTKWFIDRLNPEIVIAEKL